VFRAIGSPIRRRILDCLRDQPRTTGQLADAFPKLSRFAVMQHLTVLTTYLGRPVEAVVLNNGPLPGAALQLYAQHGSHPVVNDLQVADVPLYLAALVERPDAETLRMYARPQGPGMDVGLHLLRHDPGRLAAQIMAIAAQPPVRFGKGQE